MPTLPAWILVLYYAFFIVTLIFSIVSIVRKKLIILSIGSIFLCLTVPVIALIGAVGRVDQTEWDVFVHDLAQFKLWTIYVLYGFLFIIYWWFKFIKTSRRSS